MLILALILLMFSNSFALSVQKAKSFLNYVDSGKRFCSTSFLSQFGSGILSGISRRLFIDACFNEGKFRKAVTVRSVDGFSAFEQAVAYKKIGDIKRSKELFRYVFSKYDEFDEEVILNNLDDLSFLFDDKLIYTKVKRLISKGNLKEAAFYLNFMKDEKKYRFLNGIIFMRTGQRDKAISDFLSLNNPKSYFYLIRLERKPSAKVYFLEKLLKSDAPKPLKVLSSEYLLDRFLFNNFCYFKFIMGKTKSLDNKLYLKYKIKYDIINYKINDATRLISKLDSPCYRQLGICLKQKFGNYSGDLSLKMQKPKNLTIKNGVSSLNKISDMGLRYIVKSNRCDIISLMGKNTLDMAVANYMCKNYRKAADIAYRYKKMANRFSFIYYLLYPKPKMFKNDLLSLSIARQESFFDERAVSRSGAIGLMQIMPSTGSYLSRKFGIKGFSKNKLFNGKFNYKLGSLYFKNLLRHFKSIPLSVAAYNAGPNNVDNWIKSYGDIKTPCDLVIFANIYIRNQETRNYVKKVMRNYFIYNSLYNKKEIDAGFYPTFKKTRLQQQYN